LDTQIKTLRAPLRHSPAPAALGHELVIPACPLALGRARKLDERRQRALIRYYLDAGAGGLAVGVHTTQFAIREPQNGLFQPLLRLVAEEVGRAGRRGDRPPTVLIAGVCGRTVQALSEAAVARACGYHAALLSLGALKDASEDCLIAHCQAVAEIIPLVGFYLQPAAGGRVLPFSFWRRLVEIDRVVAIKIAPFNRYQTLDVVRAVIEAGRDDLALYTGNDDNIVLDLLTPYRLRNCDGTAERRITGGLLGQWAVWTRKAVELVDECRRLVKAGGHVPADMLRLHVELTDANAAIFDAANNFAGCIAGIHEILRRQGLLEGIWCLDPNETLSPGQAEEIDRVCRAYPHLNDDAFVAENLDRWLRD
jgi:dihydrodipicolinate synthase/N-acetylneuraminate lyase